MLRRSLQVTLAATMLLSPATAFAGGELGLRSDYAPAYAGLEKRTKIGLNKSLVLDLPADAYDVLVANPSVADAVTRTARRIYLFGKQVGQTNVIVFGPNGEQIAYYDIEVERDVAGLETYIARFLPGSNIKVELINDNVVLTGTVETPLDSKRAMQLAQAFVKGGEATTGQYSQTASGGSGDNGVAINNPDEERQSSSIINLIQIVGEDQVTLKVTVAEVSRSVMKQLGVNLIAQGSIDGISATALTGIPGGFTAPLASATGANLIGDRVQASLRAMEQSGVMKTLAEPTLTAVSGEKATFKVGGEYNILREVQPPTRDENGVVDPGGLQYQQIEYGIGLEFMPVVLSPGRISLKVRTSVSEPTTEAPSAAGSGPIGPSLRKRLADTTVELPSGGSMMIAGLVRDEVKQTIGGLPGLSKIPVLGTLFRSRDFVRNETELVVIVTPYLVKPVARAELNRPDDNFTPPSDGAGNFLGRVNRVYGTMKTDKPNGRYHGVVGFIYK
ncbi:type II and III secretion system protein family protein [Mesorhizobium sp. RP14(2022)]|uniref:Type II and III secretion system protein family protein n=1 Tax=Mesorhizobium liriopis TaxID=2953882 RepID=A0ABT1C9I2_9HYPH|nr:type II and III secretion system protein family protein [Mesorhizobium liriopis]MCO6051442.1 type II and III secretion system protein family protein [Mesorhizobium liriopis]